MSDGRHEYRCDECKATSRHHWIERTRAARLRCPACGSARLELTGKDKTRVRAPRRKRRG